MTTLQTNYLTNLERFGTVGRMRMEEDFLAVDWTHSGQHFESLVGPNGERWRKLSRLGYLEAVK